VYNCVQCTVLLLTTTTHIGWPVVDNNQVISINIEGRVTCTKPSHECVYLRASWLAFYCRDLDTEGQGHSDFKSRLYYRGDTMRTQFIGPTLHVCYVEL
jgi:hypothetical protein